MRQLQQQIISAANAAVNQASAVIDASQLYRISVQGKLSDALSQGTFQLEGSNDISVSNPPTVANWSPVATVAVMAGGLKLIPVTELSYQWLRVTWTPSAGAGTLTVNINAQGF